METVLLQLRSELNSSVIVPSPLLLASGKLSSYPHIVEGSLPIILRLFTGCGRCQKNDEHLSCNSEGCSLVVLSHLGLLRVTCGSDI